MSRTYSDDENVMSPVDRITKRRVVIQIVIVFVPDRAARTVDDGVVVRWSTYRHTYTATYSTMYHPLEHSRARHRPRVDDDG